MRSALEPDGDVDVVEALEENSRGFGGGGSKRRLTSELKIRCGFGGQV